MTNEIFERVKSNRFKHKHYSKNEIDVITQCNLVQLAIWIDEANIIFKNSQFRVADKENLVIYEHFAYDHYNGDIFPPIYALYEIFDLSFKEAIYLINYFYYKVSKVEIEDYIKINYGHSSLTEVVDEDVDLNYIISEDGFITSKSHYYYTRAIAYLYETRNIDRDIILNFINQGFLKMDTENSNLCFITYKDALTKDSVIAITRKGTTGKDYKGNSLKEHYTGFLYAKKGLIDTKDFETVYVFESCVDLMSFLTLIKNNKILLPEDENSCFISLNGAGNRKYLKKILSQYPSIEKIALCLDNDTAGIKGIERIKQDYAMCQIGTAPEIETIYRYDFCDLRMILKDISGKYGYCKDWNDVLAHSKKFSYDVCDYNL